MKLIVWKDAKKLYQLTWEIFRKFPYELKKVASNQIASVDSIHRNIAEGYCRKSLNEYLQFLNISMSSLGESVSSIYVYREANQITEEEFEEWDTLAFKIENGMKNLIEKLQYKRISGTWDDNYIVQESNQSYNN